MLYPIGIQNFEDLRRRGSVYVDKTGHVFNLASTGKYYFLSHPRRFGKSLLTFTIEAYFQGKRKLFSGLAIEGLEKDWAEHPVLHIDFSGVAYKSGDVLKRRYAPVWTSGKRNTARREAIPMSESVSRK